MKNKSFCFAILTAGLFILNSLSGFAGVVGEPDDRYSIEVDGKEIPMLINLPHEIVVNEKKVKIMLKVEPFKIFDQGGVTLEYPRYFTYETEQNDPDVKLWNLSGVSTILMIQKYAAEMEHDVMGNMLVHRFGKENTKLSECQMLMMGKEHKGTKVVTTIGDSSISQEVYSFKSKGESVLLILQDTLDHLGKGTEEGTKFRETLGRTLKINI